MGKKGCLHRKFTLVLLSPCKNTIALVQGTEDIWGANQVKEAFSALRRLGKPVELRLYHGEQHGPGAWSERKFRDVCHRVLAWFNQYLGAPQ
jgi:dipeptidyl aminopeptidase/acylaminoacyl peptidase